MSPGAASMLDGLPRKRGITHRLIRAWVFLWLLVILYSVGAFWLADRGSAFATAAGIAFGAMFVGHFVVVVTSVILQSRARQMLERAIAAADHEPRAALELARRALRTGMHARSMMRAWLLIAQLAADDARWDDADEALRRAEDTSGAMGERESVVHLHLQIAFVKAVRGELEEAEKHLLVFGTVDEAKPRLLAQWIRARALLLYKRGRFRDVVDFLEASKSRIVATGRDAALLGALEQSSLLRLQTGALRIAAPSPADDEWLASIAPEIATSSDVHG